MISKFKTILTNRYIRNVGWLGASELFNRVFRLGTTVTLARVFSQEEYGSMAIIYSTFEIASVLTFKHGISAKIIQTEEKYLTTVANTSYWLNWFLCGGIFILQCALSLPIAYVNKDMGLVLPLCVSALIYLFFPFFYGQFRPDRAGKSTRGNGNVYCWTVFY